MTRFGGERSKQLGEWELAARLQSILINAAEGRRSVADDRDYSHIRQVLTRRSCLIPSLVSTHPTVDSFTAFIKGIEDRKRRVEMVRAEFDPLFGSLGENGPLEVESSSWTGQQSRADRLRVIQGLLPLAQTSVESMIEMLSEPGDNGGPILEERKEAIEHLRELHRTLGNLLQAADTGRLDDELGQGLVADAARYAKRAARALRNDPMPYLASALLLGIFSACGFPGIGGYLSGVAVNLRRRSGLETE